MSFGRNPTNESRPFCSEAPMSTAASVSDTVKLLCFEGMDRARAGQGLPARTR